MNIKAKRRSSIIAVFISLILMLGALFGVIFSSNMNNVDAQAYNYGTFNTAGYYTLDGVVFYAVKVKDVNGINEATITKSETFVIGGVTYTIVEDTITYDGGSITITDGEFTINDVDYEFDDDNNRTKVLLQSGGTEVATIVYKDIFTIGGVLYTINYNENENVIKYTGGTKQITDGKFTINDVDYEFDNNDNRTKVLFSQYSYWPNYNVVTDTEGNPVFVRFGETVLLEDNESILISFARQTNSSSGDSIYVGGETKLSASVDFITGLPIKINNVSQPNAVPYSLSSGASQEKEFGYILNLNNKTITGQGEASLLGIANGTVGSVNNEGLIEFDIGYTLGSGNKNYSFMFYAFKKSTYQRTETLNTAQSFPRPAPSLKVNATTPVEYVLDSETKNRFFSESFYYFADQQLPYLEYDYTRYEIDIVKTIHTTNTTYKLSYDPVSGDFVVSKNKNVSTANIYARDLILEKIEGTTKVRVYFSDLGVYDIGYTAVYFGTGDKVKLDTLNLDQRTDRLTIFGTQATYQDMLNARASFRSDDNLISADITGVSGIALEGDNNKLTTPPGFVIASTNQPPVSLLFNSPIEECTVYYSPSLTGAFEESSDSYTSNFTLPGYYYIEITNKYASYKKWIGASNATEYSSTTMQTQKYLFQIKDQTPDLKIYQLKDDGSVYAQPETNAPRVYSGRFENNNYIGSYTKNGVQFLEIERGSIFDSEITYNLKWRSFAQTDSQLVTITLPSEPAGDLTPSQISYLAGYGIVKHQDGYYTLKNDGHYVITINFGNSGSATCLFDIDTEQIGGIRSYNVEAVTGSNYYRYNLLAQATFATTNNSIALLWNPKASGANITAKYVRYELAPSDYSELLGAGSSDDDYILNSTWLATDYSIRLSGTNPETLYTKANNESQITSSSVLGLSGLYIFKLQDEAGNIAYYSLLIDKSIPTILQKPNEYEGNYRKITGINNISVNTDIFFGTHKAISFVLGNQLVSPSLTGLISLLNDENEDYEPVFAEYFSALFDNLSTLGANNLIKQDPLSNHYYVTIPITKVVKKVFGGNSSDLSPAILAQGYDTLIPPRDAYGLIDVTYVYQIFDASNKTVTPSASHTVRVNSDLTGVTVFYYEDEDEKQLDIIATKTTVTVLTRAERIKYFSPTQQLKLYLTWGDLYPDGLGAHVDLGSGGLVCRFFELVYNTAKNSYDYSINPIDIPLDFGDYVDDIEKLNNGETVAIPINFSSSGNTYAGKYEIIRTYTLDEGVESVDYGDDYERVVTTFYVDRNPIVSAPGVNQEQIGHYTYLALFDGGDARNCYDKLYQQSQASNNYVIQTNKLPIGFYIPLTKYGTVYQIISGIQTETVVNKENVQSGKNALDQNIDYRYIDLMQLKDLDINLELGRKATASPFVLTVTLTAPSGTVYYYSYNHENGYLMLSGYRLYGGTVITPITDHKAFIEKNPLTNQPIWETGTYTLRIEALENTNVDAENPVQFAQSFKFLINVVTPTPSYNLTAEYPDLNNMDARDISAYNGNYYTNADRIVVNWTESINDYLTEIDRTKIEYVLFINSVRQTPIILKQSDILENGKNYSFVINVPTGTNVTRIEITMAFKTYSTDSTTDPKYTKYYGNNWRSQKVIIIDKIAPVGSIDNSANNLKNSDETVKSVSNALLRASTDSQGNPLDSRFNKTIITGIYRYYSYMTAKSYFETLKNKLLINSPEQTKVFYYRAFDDKYSTSTSNETWLGLDKESEANNVFSEYYATIRGWTKVTSESILNSGSFNDGYYEIIEVDLAGNMTIYTIYVTNGAELNINFEQKKSANPTEGNLNISKIDGKIEVSYTGLDEPETNPAYIELISFDQFKFKSIYFENTNVDRPSYKYLKIEINGTTYLVTPFGYENVTIGGETVYACKYVYKLTGERINLEDIVLPDRNTFYRVNAYDTINRYSDVNKKAHEIRVSVNKLGAQLTDNDGAGIIPDSEVLKNAGKGEHTLAVFVKERSDASLRLDADSLFIYKINASAVNEEEDKIVKYRIEENNIGTYSATSGGITTIYYYIVDDETFDLSVFYIAFKDTFEREYHYYREYKDLQVSRYESAYDITPESQLKKTITVSSDLTLNISNLYDTQISVMGSNGNYNNYTVVPSSGDNYNSFRLLAAPITQSAGYYGGIRRYKVELLTNVNPLIINELIGADYKDISLEDNENVIETLYITIYNQTPYITATNQSGIDITQKLFSKEITQSGAVTLTFLSGNDISEEIGYVSKVFLRLRGSEEGFVEITSPTTVSQAGIYDIYVQNFGSDGKALGYRKTDYDFVISGIDVMFYTVVKGNGEGIQQIVSPTGSVFTYPGSGGVTQYVPYHYIVNTNDYQVLTNGENVNKDEILVPGLTGTKIYRIWSTTGTIFETRIAITVVPKATNIVGSFTWNLGTTYTDPTPDSYITSTSRNLYLSKLDEHYDEVLLRWSSYYSMNLNKVTCYVSSDDGATWNKITGVTSGTSTTLILRKSGSYLFRFVDYAGNEQTFTSQSGYPSTTTRINFIRSVIYKINGANPLDNSVFNGEVKITIPAGTTGYYSSTPVINVLKDNKAYTVNKNANGEYVFTEPGTYMVYFSAKILGAANVELKEDKLTFTIINKNDSRWAFNYANYNGYRIDYIRYNGIALPSGLSTLARSANEINISAFVFDSLGNRYFDNGIYSIKISAVDEAFGTQSFEFEFWLNNAVPPITVSLPEGQSTTGNIIVKYNRANLYEILGDCQVVINGAVIETINSQSTGLFEQPYTDVRSYSIQVFTSSGKLAYSYSVSIDEPLNTVTIVLIIVSSVVFVTGVLLFFILRKKMKVR